MPEFKDRLEEALKMRNMRPADLARLTGIGEGAISQYRKGAYKATQRNLEKISKVLGVSIPWLMGAADEKAPAQVGAPFDEPEIRAIQRAAKNMTQGDKQRMLAMLQIAFHDAFEDDEGGKP